ncbi:MAG: V-type ATP synthase subunit I [Candidatus Diapherotrites archaeon]
MFRSATIFHAKAIVPKSKANELILKLHETGISELKKTDTEHKEEFIIKEEESLNTSNVRETQAKLNDLLTKIDSYREIVTADNMLKQLFFPSPPEKYKIDLLSNEEIVNEVNENLEKIKPKIDAKLLELDETKSKIDNNNYLISNLGLLPEQQTNLFESTENLSVQIGIINPKSIELFKEKLKKTVVSVKEKNETQAFVYVVSSTENKGETDKVLHEVGFESIKVPFENKAPKKIIENLKKENKTLEAKTKTIEQEVKEITRTNAKRLDILTEELDIAIQRIDAYNQIQDFGSTAIIEAWVPEKNFSEFKEVLKEKAGNFYLMSKEREDAPTLFNHSKLIEPFEIITELYSVPKYKEFDPTPIVAISFAVFFGYMLTDFVYGVVLFLLAFFMYNGLGKYEPGLRKFSALLMIGGISTALLGAFFKSYLGDFFPRIGIELPGVLDPLAQVLEIIILSLAIASVHLFIGLVIGYYENARKGKMIDALGLQGVWLFLLIGGISVLIGEGIFQMIGFALVGLAVITQLAYNYIQNGPIISVLSIFNISGFLGDVFSYARLTALAIGTAGIALAVNFMALMVVDMVPVVGIVFGAMIFIGGHIFNMVMNGMGAFIHALRLHFLEFFSKFYDGGGKLYKPFYALRKKNYTEGK